MALLQAKHFYKGPSLNLTCRLVEIGKASCWGPIVWVEGSGTPQLGSSPAHWHHLEMIRPPIIFLKAVDERSKGSPEVASYAGKNSTLWHSDTSSSNIGNASHTSLFMRKTVSLTYAWCVPVVSMSYLDIIFSINGYGLHLGPWRLPIKYFPIILLSSWKDP